MEETDMERLERLGREKAEWLVSQAESNPAAARTLIPDPPPGIVFDR